MSDPTGRHLALIGLSGTGKSTVASLLSVELGLPLIDLDREVERLSGCSITDLFSERGESGFRDIEAEALVEALAGPDAVVATGGGIVLRPANRRRIAAAADVVWLVADVRTLAGRLSNSREVRPLVHDAAGSSGLDPLAANESRLSALDSERHSLYQELADVVIDASGPPAEVSERIVEWLTARRFDHSGADKGATSTNVGRTPEIEDPEPRT